MSTVNGQNVANGFKQGSVPYGDNKTIPTNITYSIAPGAANVTEVTITVKDAEGGAVPTLLDVWLSDAASGVGLTAVTASGAVAAKAASGVDFVSYVAKKALKVQTLSTGIYILSITDTAKTGFYIAVRNPYSQNFVVSRQLLTADYA